MVSVRKRWRSCDSGPVQRPVLTSDSGQCPGKDRQDRGAGLLLVGVGVRLHIHVVPWSHEEGLPSPQNDALRDPPKTKKNYVLVVKPRLSGCRKSFAAARVWLAVAAQLIIIPCKSCQVMFPALDDIQHARAASCGRCLVDRSPSNLLLVTYYLFAPLTYL